ncbi:MAG: hypothetical protein AB7F40_00195 [Victivallaceae bacterium]|nr:hypothetical protein [Victivallaceae bacterium]
MTKFEQDVIDRLARIETKLDSDGQCLRGGDGNPGLVQQVNTLDGKVQTLESDKKHWYGAAIVVGFLLNLAVGICALFKR